MALMNILDETREYRYPMAGIVFPNYSFYSNFHKEYN